MKVALKNSMSSFMSVEAVRTLEGSDDAIAWALLDTRSEHAASASYQRFDYTI
jgi:hypothetical protein